MVIFVMSRIIDVKSRTKTRSMPYYCAYDSRLERLHVTDYDNDQVLTYCAVTCQYLFRFGKRGIKSFCFNKPTGIAYSKKNKVLFVADCWNHKLHVIKTPRSDMLSRTRPTSSSGSRTNLHFSSSTTKTSGYKHKLFIGDVHSDSTHPYYLAYPGGVCVDDASERVYVADRNGEKIVVFSFDGNPVGLITSGIRTPTGISFDQETSRLYVCDPSCRLVKVFTKDGRYISSLEAGKDSVCHPYGVGVIHHANMKVVAVSEMNECRIRFHQLSNRSQPSSSYDPGNEFVEKTIIVGSEGVGTMEFVYPRGVCAMSNGRVCIVDSENARMHIIDAGSLFSPSPAFHTYDRPVIPPLNLERSPNVSRLVHIHQTMIASATPRSQSPRVANDRLITSVRRERDLRHLCDVTSFIASTSSLEILKFVNTVNTDSFFSTLADNSQTYVDLMIEKKKKTICAQIAGWEWDKFSKESLVHLIRFVLAVQYSSDMGWFMAVIFPKIEALSIRYTPHIAISTESALGYNTTTKAVYRSGMMNGSAVFIKTIVLENEMWWHRELDHNIILRDSGIVEMKDYYFDYHGSEIGWKLNLVFQYVGRNYADVLSMWIRANAVSPSGVPSLLKRVEICISLSKTIETLHIKFKLIHRDIKLQNVLCCDDLTPLVCDLGLSETEDLFHTRSICEGPCDDLAPDLTNVTSHRMASLGSSRDRNRVIKNPYAIDVFNLGGVIFMILTLTHHTQLRTIDEWMSLDVNENERAIQRLVCECRNPHPEERISITTVIQRLQDIKELQ